MKKRNLLYTLLAAVLVVLLAVTPANTHAEETDDGTISTNGMTLSKHATVQEDGTYIIDLEAFTTGEVTTTYETAPADIVLVLDVSGSMKNHMYSYTPRASQGYSYNSYGNNTFYYLHTDGNYYQVRRRNNGGGGWGWSGDVRELYFTIDGREYYLSGSGVTTSEPNSPTSNSRVIWTGVLYERKDEGTKIEALKTAVHSFLNIVAEKNADAAVASDPDKQSRVAIVKFADTSINGENYQDYQSNIGNDKYSGYNYTLVMKDLTVLNATTLGNENDTYSNANSSFRGAVNSLSEGGATAADYGMKYAKAIFDKYPISANSNRSRVVVMFTDGEPNHYSGFDGTVANSAISTSYDLKNDKANPVKVFSVAVLEGADPTLDPTASTTSNVNKYLHGVSSNFIEAAGYEDLGTRNENPDGTKPNFYFTAATAEQLSGIFTAIAQQSGSPTTEVGTSAVLKDIVSSSFTLPEGATEDNINIEVVRWNSYKHRWGTKEDSDGNAQYVFTPDEWKTVTAAGNFGAEAAEDVQVILSSDKKTIDITGFDYSTHFKATKPNEDNDAVDQVNGVNKNTAKIHIWFEIDAKPSAVTGGGIATNGEDSGLYVDGELLLRFPVPKVVFTPVTYVVDYVNLPSNGDNKPSTITLDYSHVLKNVEMLDDPSDDVLKGKLLTATGDDAFDFTIFKGRYGTISFGDSATDVNKKMFVRYAPTTMNWDDYDRIFIKGESASDSTLDVWAMLAVLPANSVYYEDTYVTKETNVTYNNHEVTIEYTGINYDSNWSSVGAEGANNTQHAEGLMGWIDVLADDPGYSNGEAHTADANTAKAKATFTFSGTGVDIYSRTNGSTGTITVNVKSTAENNESGKKVNKSKIIDTKAAAGDYYGIPVCTFTDLPYGKYDVTITVTTGAKKEGRTIFYLDGIRVYNPIKPHEGEELVQQMYGEQNLGAIFTEVRSLLGTSATATALFIDEHTTTETVTDLEAIDKAAQDLAKAQDDLDAYVEANVTPKQLALNAAEAALAEAKEGDENYESLKAARDAAKAELDTALAGKSDYEDAVAAARTAYDAANTGAEVTYTTTDVAEYKKEGPLGEVLLDAGESVTISVESGKTYYVGLKSLDGSSVTAEINGKAATFTHTADLYYDATPASGSQIVIRNGGQNILSVTKLRTTGKGNTTNGTSAASTEELLAYVRTLRTMPVTEYTGNVLTEDVADDTVVSAETTVEEETETVIEEDEITIENGDPVSEDIEATEESAVSGWYRFLSSFFGFFRP